MEYRRLGPLNVSVIGLGTWPLAGSSWGQEPGWPKLTEYEVQETLQAAWDAGVTLTDTAPVYGQMEAVVGWTGQHRRHQLVYATKVGQRREADGRIVTDNSRAAVITSCHESCQNLKTETLDLLQVHWPDPTVPIAETMVALRELHEAGTIRAIGVSNFDRDQLAEALTYAPVHAIQVPYNLLDRRIENDLLPFCRERTIAVIAYNVLARGFLTGKYRPGNAQPSDLRSDDPLFSEAGVRRYERLFNELEKLAAEHGTTVSALATRWIADQRGITAVLCGARSAAQAAANAAVGTWQMSPELRHDIRCLIHDVEMNAPLLARP